MKKVDALKFKLAASCYTNVTDLNVWKAYLLNYEIRGNYDFNAFILYCNFKSCYFLHVKTGLCPHSFLF